MPWKANTLPSLHKFIPHCDHSGQTALQRGSLGQFCCNCWRHRNGGGICLMLLMKPNKWYLPPPPKKIKNLFQKFLVFSRKKNSKSVFFTHSAVWCCIAASSNRWPLPTCHQPSSICQTQSAAPTNQAEVGAYLNGGFDKQFIPHNICYEWMKPEKV